MNVQDFVDAKCRCNFVNWESTVKIFKAWDGVHVEAQDTTKLSVKISNMQSVGAILLIGSPRA